MPKKLDLTGMVFGMLTVLCESGKTKGGVYCWLCKCACGNEKVIQGPNIKNGHTKSCGCLNKNGYKGYNWKHGLYKTSEHHIWIGMRQRCRDKNSQGYKKYGARGIKVCERWESFENFYADMGPRPSLKHSLDRIDNDGHYEPSNCRWATPAEQMINRRPRECWDIDMRARANALLSFGS